MFLSANWYSFSFYMIFIQGQFCPSGVVVCIWLYAWYPENFLWHLEMMCRHQLCAKPLFEVILYQSILLKVQDNDFCHSFLQQDFRTLLSQVIWWLTQQCNSDNLHLYSVVLNDMYCNILIWNDFDLVWFVTLSVHPSVCHQDFVLSLSVQSRIIIFRPDV